MSKFIKAISTGMRKRPLIIGLTGGFGTGKTTVAAMFKEQGAAIVDADAITRQLLVKNKKCIKKVAKAFPRAILQSGEIDRKQLASIVFQHPRDLKKLTNILYPEALKEVTRKISLHKSAPLVILDVPMLFEAGWDKLCRTTIVVQAKRDQQIKRIQQRMKLEKSAVLRRIKLQMPLPEKCRRADIIIDNSGALRATRQQVGAIIHRLNKRLN
jgi:dephospho-CoA kinase